MSETQALVRPARVRVLIASADLRTRVRLNRWLGSHGSFEVAGEATDGAQAVAAATRARPQLVVLDLALARMHGLEAATEIRRLLPETRIVVCSTFSAHRMAQAAIDAGADAYVEKASDSFGLLSVLEELAGPVPTTAEPVEPVEGSLTWPAETMELLEAIVVVSPVGAVLLDSAAQVVIANPVADRLVGGTVLLVAGPGGRTLRRADTKERVRDEDLPVQAACQGTPFDDLELFVAADEGAGGGHYVKISGRPVFGADGRPTGAVFSVLDDTAAKEAERALAETYDELRRSNTELAYFASSASHDLAQPLQKILGFAELLQERGLDDPHAPDHVDRIVAACQRMRTLIQDLLDYGRVTSDDRPVERVDLTAVMAEVVELFEQQITESGGNVTVDPLPTVVADLTQMTQLLQNLVGNALTYVGDGVTPQVHVTAVRVDRVWQITVADNGIGIASEDRERAFGMFQRLVSAEDYDGTGIGLALCAKIVDRHGGRIWIDDNPDGGSRISFTLPARS